MNHTIAIPSEAEALLASLAQARRVSADQLLAEIIDEHLVEMALSQEADEVYARYLAGEEETISLDVLEKKLGMAN
jgi:predicted DNA-binding protein